jgi:hypothetical protein
VNDCGANCKRLIEVTSRESQPLKRAKTSDVEPQYPPYSPLWALPQTRNRVYLPAVDAQADCLMPSLLPLFEIFRTALSPGEAVGSFATSRSLARACCAMLQLELMCALPSLDCSSCSSLLLLALDSQRHLVYLRAISTISVNNY